MLYEYRRYYVTPGRMPDLVARMNDHTAHYFERHGVRLVGAWQPVTGESHALHYLLAWNDLNERQERWGAFASDPDWRAALKASDSQGVIRDHAYSEIWSPIGCSPAQ